MATELPSLVILPHEMSRKFPLQLRGLVRVNRVVLAVVRSLPLHPSKAAWANIPPKRNRKDPSCFSPYLYRARKIKQCRRVATRYDKLAANYLAFVKLASIRIWLRANESAP